MKKSTLLICIGLCFAGCENVTQPPQPTTAVTPAPRKKIAKHAGPTVLAVVKDTGFREPQPAKPTGLMAARAKPNDGVSFAGTARKAAKLSIASGQPATRSLEDLITWCRSHDAGMRNHEPPISKDAKSGRLPEEEVNVTVDGWVHYAKKEADNDYHLIIGTSDNLDQSDLMNVEISGLPPHSSRAYSEVSTARTDFQQLFAAVLSQMTQAGYAQLTPTHVRITGSLFYDIDHPAGAVGPTGHRAKSAWEIHPITSFASVQ